MMMTYPHTPHTDTMYDEDQDIEDDYGDDHSDEEEDDNDDDHENGDDYDDSVLPLHLYLSVQFWRPVRHDLPNTDSCFDLDLCSWISVQ